MKLGPESLWRCIPPDRWAGRKERRDPDPEPHKHGTFGLWTLVCSMVNKRKRARSTELEKNDFTARKEVSSPRIKGLHFTNKT